MSVIVSSSSTTVSTALPVVEAKNNVIRKSEINLSDLSSLLLEVNQKLRDTMQKRNNAQSINSFKLAENSVEKKRESADKTMEATKLNSIFSIVGGTVGGGLGLLPGITKGMGKLGGGKSAEELAIIKNRRENSGMNEVHVQKLTDMDKCKVAQKLYDFGERSKAAGMALAPTLPGLINGIGGAETAGATREASRLQTAADFINSSQSSYDRHRENDVNDARQFSQKITDTARLIADIHGGTVNALNWK